MDVIRQKCIQMLSLVEKDGFATENAENNAMKDENKTSDTDSDLEKIVIDSINDILNM